MAQYKGFEGAKEGMTGLFKFELGSGKFISRFDLPADGKVHSLANMTIAENGDIYVADAAFPIVFRLKSGNKIIQPFMASPRFISIRGLALSADSKRLYVADHDNGTYQ